MANIPPPERFLPHAATVGPYHGPPVSVDPRQLPVASGIYPSAPPPPLPTATPGSYGPPQTAGTGSALQASSPYPTPSSPQGQQEEPPPPYSVDASPGTTVGETVPTYK